MNKKKLPISEEKKLAINAENELQKCKTDLHEAKETLLENHNTKAEQKKQLRLAHKEIEKAEIIQKIYEKGLRKMMYIVSHKIRQPISKIMGLSLLLEEGVENPDEVQEIIDYLKQSSELLDGFTRELSQFITKQESIKNDYKEF